MKRLRVAIDGPAASGKTTTAREVAERLGYRYLDSGALYRALAVKASREGLDPDDVEAIEACLARTDGDYGPDGEVRLDGEALGPELRSPAVSDLASRLSVHPPVRAWVNDRLRAAATGGEVVMEGRDIGTVVLPDAEVKVFLEARITVRVDRRHRDLETAGHTEPRDKVAEDLERRDTRDSGRPVAPLMPAPDAIVLDGSDLSFDQQVEKVLALVADRAR